jgi:hypothetical protein
MPARHDPFVRQQREAPASAAFQFQRIAVDKIRKAKKAI